MISVANLAARSIRRDRNVYVMRFNAGDFMVCNGTSAFDVINSTELCAVGVNVREIGLFPAEADVNDPDALIKWELSRNDEAEALTWYR